MKLIAGIKSNAKPQLPDHGAVVSSTALDAPWQLERGAVTAELAVALPAVVLLLITILAIAAAFGTQMRVSDAARTGARLYSIGRSQPEVKSQVIQIAGANSTINIAQDGEWATISVKRPVSLGPANLGIFTLSAEAVVWIEP